MLKKVFFLFLLCILICGCTANKSVAPVLENISFTAEAEYGGQQFSCEVLLLEKDAKITVLKPKEIKGLILEYTNGVVSGNFCGVSFNPDKNKFPINSVSQLLYDTVSDIKVNKYASDFGTDNCEITGRIGYNDYILKFSPSGLPISLEFRDLKLVLQFNNVILQRS